MFASSTARLKTTLRLCLARLKLIRNKKGGGILTLKKEVAGLLATGKEESAAIRVEALIRETMVVETMEVLELYAELISVRAPILERCGKSMPEDMREAITSCMFAAPRLSIEIPELKQIATYFRNKFGSDFANFVMAEESAEGVGVSPRVIIKLAVVAPSPAYRNQILSDVAREMGVAWEPQVLCDDDDDKQEVVEEEAEKEKLKNSSGMQQQQTAKMCARPLASPSVDAMPLQHAPTVDTVLPSQQQDTQEYKTAAEAARAAREFADKAAAAAEAAAALAAAEAGFGSADDSTASGSEGDGGNAVIDETKVNEILNDAVAAAEAAEFAAEAAADDDSAGVDDTTLAMLADISPDQSVSSAAGDVPNGGIGTDVFSSSGQRTTSEFDALTKRFEALKKK